MSQLHWLDQQDLWFPPSELALRDPDGLLAVGGDLSVERLVASYSRGIFPWYSEGQPLLWWTPDPRMVMSPNDIYLSKSLRKLLRKQPFTIKVDTAFSAVVKHCGSIPRRDQDGSWITPEMIAAYLELHELQIAHSVEAWSDNTLVGGLYGVSLGRVFYGESMFSLQSGASKVAFVALCQQLQQWQFGLVDCQIQSDHLASLGAAEIPRDVFEAELSTLIWEKPAGAANHLVYPEVLESSEAPPILHWRKAWQLPEYGFDGTSDT
ncbi:leucyl/phenylalanyl-tRNA--protein transferase [Alteromonadaceae bacterium 2753L.S.0a.02]|nr:leucyl/phenylalanyl-tRNA--protein transferase [Alteromonadaceae bacterium 2753L.S.0a.02]